MKQRLPLHGGRGEALQSDVKASNDSETRVQLA